MLNTQFSPWPSFTQEEADAVSRVILSNKVNYWTGEECRRFEEEFAHWAGVPHAIALANGTLALDLALHGLGIGHSNGGRDDDEVIVTPRSFIASVSCVINAGAVLVFADVDMETGNLSAETIRPHLSPRTKAVIPVHIGGLPCDMDPIMSLSQQHGFKVIEDCAQAHGALYKGRSVGTIGHVGAWSFCQDKILTTGGEGGMVTCHDQALWSRMWSFKDHGKSFEAVYQRQHPPGFRWLHESIGTNWRMLEVQAAIGRIQLRRLPDWKAARQANAEAYASALKPFAGDNGSVRLVGNRCASCQGCGVTDGCQNAHYRFYFYVRPENLAPEWNRDRIVEAIKDFGVPAYQGTCSEIYLEKAFDGTSSRPAQRLPAARTLGETSIMLLTHPTLKDTEIARTVEALRHVFSQAQGILK
jgi:dTDP-4-amino-4,6-dideoxygalactose transaminase